MSVITCDLCKHPMGNDTSCPHCGRPSKFPNVVRAEVVQEVTELELRYQNAISAAKALGTGPILQQFGVACENTQVMMGYSLGKLGDLAVSDIFATYYQIEELMIRGDVAPGSPDWAILRPQAEIQLMGNEKFIRQIHYGLLTIDEAMENRYGECTLILREDMVSHRVSCFEENTGVYWLNHKDFPPGKRSFWLNRHKLCVAKSANTVAITTTPADFQSILYDKGTSPLNEKFVEVQIFGRLTARAVRIARASKAKIAKWNEVLWKAIRLKLEACNVIVSET